MRTNTLDNWTPIVPVESKTRVNDSSDILSQLGWVSYTCETTGARFFAPTLEQAQVKAAEAIQKARQHDRVLTVDDIKKKPAPKKAKRKLKHPTRKLKRGDTVNEWTMLSDYYKGEHTWMIDAKCSCGSEHTMQLNSLTVQNASKGCRDCAKTRAAKAARKDLIETYNKRFPIGEKIMTWEVVSGAEWTEGLGYRINLKCKCGAEKKANPRRIGSCNECRYAKLRLPDIPVGGTKGAWKVIGETTDDQGRPHKQCECMTCGFKIAISKRYFLKRSKQCAHCRRRKSKAAERERALAHWTSVAPKVGTMIGTWEVVSLPYREIAKEYRVKIKCKCTKRSSAKVTAAIEGKISRCQRCTKRKEHDMIGVMDIDYLQISKLLNEKGVSYREIGLAVGVNRETVSRWVHRKSRPVSKGPMASLITFAKEHLTDEELKRCKIKI